uniref:TIL domain-containing protein n=1 Tax=Steinernema glaseri TaxID=37863 RepID=A0A1I7XZ91_9BILA
MRSFIATLILVQMLPLGETQSCSWLSWSSWSDCTDSCGSCGIHIRSRTCLSSDDKCQCEGSGTQIDYCNLEVCLHPRPTCCFDTTVTVREGKFVCAPANGGVLVPLFS